MTKPQSGILPQLLQLARSDHFRGYVDTSGDWVNVCNRLKGLTGLAVYETPVDRAVRVQLFANITLPIQQPKRCNKCANKLTSYRSESTGPYLYCSQCKTGAHPLPPDQRIDCDDDDYCRRELFSIMTMLLRKAFAAILIEQSLAFNRRTMTLDDTEYWTTLKQIRDECLEYLTLDHSPLPNWYSGSHASEHKQSLKNMQHQLIPNGATLFNTKCAVGPLSCPDCGGVPEYYDRIQIEFFHQEKQLTVSVRIPLHDKTGHSWNAVGATAPLTITDESGSDTTAVQFWDDELTGLAMAISGRSGELVAFSLDAILKRLLFKGVGWSGSYSESRILKTISPLFTSIDGLVNSKRGLLIRLSAPTKWFSYS